MTRKTLSPGDGCVECHPISAKGQKSHAGQTGPSTNSTPWITGQIIDASSRGRLYRKGKTLAVKAFGDMGPNVRLRLIRDRFVASHENCALRQHLDSVPPETPIQDIVVWESHADMGVRRIVKPVTERALPGYIVDEP